MMTPAPESNSYGWNLTPLTILVTTQPSLKKKLNEFGRWNKDIASDDVVPSKLLRVAKPVENYWKVSSKLNTEANRQL